jgi:SAM-dependent methyltransferase
MKINRQNTQVKSTEGTYRKVAEFIASDSEGRVPHVLDYGAGECHGTAILNDAPNMVASSFEPNPKDGVEPDFTEIGESRGQYDYVVNNCVLNVIEDRAERLRVAIDIIDSLAPGGTAIIMVRSHSAVNSNKSNVPYADGFYVENSKTWQRGHTKAELAEMMEEAIRLSGKDFTIEKTDLGDVGVLVKRP